LAGMQEDGKRFFYVNPLEVIPGIAGVAKTHKHDLPERPTWYACACCPPNVSRMITSFGKYAYGENKNNVFCHLFAAGTVNFENGTKIKCKTDYPYGFSIEYEIEAAPENMSISIRIPSWSKKYKITKNGNEIEADAIKIESGYVYLPIEKGDKITIELDSNPYIVYPSSKIPDLSGQIAICRGPLVYCAEGIDNKEEITGLFILNNTSNIKTQQLENGIVILMVPGARQENTEDLYLDEEPNLLNETIRQSSLSGYFPPNANITSPIAHELGHYISFFAMRKNNKIDQSLLYKKDDHNYYLLIDKYDSSEFSKQMLDEAYKLYLDEGNTQIEFDKWRGTISQYAITKNESGKELYDETIAEAFHDVYLNKDNAKLASKYIIKILKKYVEES
jgi:hypothetical protein